MINRVERFPVRIDREAVVELRARRRPAGGLSLAGLAAALATGVAIGYFLAFVLPR